MARRDGTKDDEDGPERTCVATRVARPVDELIRFVADPDGVVVPDLRRRLPGRGVWVTANAAAVAEAVKRKAFARGLKRPVTVSAGLADEVDALLKRAARESVSLANKAGQVVSGFSKVEAAIGRGQLAALVEAADAKPDGVRKLGQALRRSYGEDAVTIPVVRVLASTDLDLALGRSHVIHAALLEGPASRACLARCRALERYRVGPDPQGPATPQTQSSDATAREPAGCERNE